MRNPFMSEKLVRDYSKSTILSKVKQRELPSWAQNVCLGAMVQKEISFVMASLIKDWSEYSPPEMMAAVSLYSRSLKYEALQIIMIAFRTQRCSSSAAQMQRGQRLCPFRPLRTSHEQPRKNHSHQQSHWRSQGPYTSPRRTGVRTSIWSEERQARKRGYGASQQENDLISMDSNL